MSKELVRKAMEECMPVLDAFDTFSLVKENLFIVAEDEDYTVDLRIHFKINVSEELKKHLPTMFDNIMKSHLGTYTMLPDDEYYLIYNPLDKISSVYDESKGGFSRFAVKHKGDFYYDCGEIIDGGLMYMDVLKHPKLEEIKQKIAKKIDECYEWLKEQMRNMVSESDVKGIFLQDDILYNTYNHRRIENDTHYDYIVGNWIKKLAKNKPIEWVDFMNKEKVYVALN